MNIKVSSMLHLILVAMSQRINALFFFSVTLKICSICYSKAGVAGTVVWSFRNYSF